jgi:hypothetical protein
MQLCESYNFTTTAETTDNDQDDDDNDPKKTNTRRPRNHLASSGMIYAAIYFRFFILIVQL